jgi:hypothetical protein
VREYNPATGSFVSADPLLAPYDPQDLNPYAYALDDPASQSDPSGAFSSYNTPQGTCTGTGQSCQTVYDNQQQGLQQQARASQDEARTVDHDYVFEVAVTVIDRTPRAVTPVQQSVGTFSPSYGGCQAGFEIKWGACPGESGAAGTTPGQVRQSLIGDVLDALGGLFSGADAVTAAGTETGTVAAADTAGAAGSDGGTTQLFRNVGPEEFDAIATTGRFSTGEGQMEGKWFATQGAHAEQWGQLLNNGEGVTVETSIPQSVADQLYYESGKLDGIGPAYYAYGEQLDLINQAMDGIRVWP